MKNNNEFRTIDKSILERPLLAARYAQVFAGEPWKEVSKCDVCGSFDASDPTASVSCKKDTCKGTYSLPAYPVDQTQVYIQSELSKPKAQGYVKPKLEDILGFVWGYADTGAEFAKQKYETEEMRSIVLALLGTSGAFFYFSEIGVIPSEQNKGLGTRLADILISKGKKEMGSIVLRTNEDSGMRYIAQNMGMKAIVGLRSGIRDSENIKRVIFVGGNNATI